MRNTKRKRAILAFLEGEHDFLEYGTAPYSATVIAEVIGDGSVQSVARTLRGMAKVGLLVSVKDRQPVWNAIAQGDIDTGVTAYYSVRTMEHDILAAKMWHDGAADRSARAFQSMMGFSKRIAP